MTEQLSDQSQSTMQLRASPQHLAWMGLWSTVSWVSHSANRRIETNRSFGRDSPVGQSWLTCVVGLRRCPHVFILVLAQQIKNLWHSTQVKLVKLHQHWNNQLISWHIYQSNQLLSLPAGRVQFSGQKQMKKHISRCFLVKFRVKMRVTLMLIFERVCDLTNIKYFSIKVKEQSMKKIETKRWSICSIDKVWQHGGRNEQTAKLVLKKTIEISLCNVVDPHVC